MQSTGRIKSTLHPEASAIVFDSDLQRATKDELPFYADIDRAQAVMLERVGLIDRALARKVLTELDKLQAESFQSIASRPAPRGSYLAYEDHLRSVIGNEASNLHLGRSRNDINATLLKLKLRAPYQELSDELLRLLRLLCSLAREHLETVFPLHTHRQPALPSTFAHHLTAFASALARDLDALLAVHPILNLSCLGAGAGGGTTLPILPELTARLLGFSSKPLNSIDSVASRDLVLRMLAACAILGSSLSRIAETLLLWVGDHGLATLPDELVGSSSAMPHKRNPFLLEQVQGKAGAIVGCFVAAITAMHSTPFTNCVAVGTEAARNVWPGIDHSIGAVRLMRLCFSGLIVAEDAAAAMLGGSFVNAMETANRLTLGGHLDFRSAHNEVGRLVTTAIECGAPSLLALGQHDWVLNSENSPAPDVIARAARAGGGPAPDAVTTSLYELESGIDRAGTLLRDLVAGWSLAQLRSEIANLQQLAI
ncbi:argininosuccinate lyase [Bradyrhizobium sp. 38]|uniref:lyase family protein n=1 Tax=unclassified Bradyrhizobium TaxID=2631580 RepID=UPI001FF82B73|nr:MULTISPECIES: lyase family protein [unclassified Bradyrhizobium]MCK1338574.1 argininosuccinate lyase [Bradyrhizobium sp. 38]MCK1778660.1 argininosuccinate lyase [Bradyrhizobium sp. 132]